MKAKLARSSKGTAKNGKRVTFIDRLQQIQEARKSNTKSFMLRMKK